MDATAICIDTGPLIAYLKGREPGASAVARVVQERTCYVTSITILTLNARHFSRVPELQVVTPEDVIVS